MAVDYKNTCCSKRCCDAFLKERKGRYDRLPDDERKQHEQSWKDEKKRHYDACELLRSQDVGSVRKPLAKPYEEATTYMPA